MWRSLKTCTIEEILLSNNMLKVNSNTLKQDVKSVEVLQRKEHRWRSFWVLIVNFEWNLTASSITSIVNFEHAFVY